VDLTSHVYDLKKQHNFRQIEIVRELIMKNNQSASLKELEPANEKLIREITERKRAEEIIRQQNEFLEHILESLPHPFYVIDSKDYTIKLANSAARFDSLSEDSTCYALTHNRNTPCEGIEYSCPLKVVKSTGKPFTVRHIHYDKDGNVKHFEVHAYPIFDQQGNVVQIIEYSLDITERVRIEEMMIQSEKMLSVGGLAAGIAHELNNPLASMLQNTQVVLNRLTETFPANSRAADECGITMEAIKHFVEKREIVKMLEMVRISGERATQIVKDMLSFSHKSEYHIFPLHNIRKLLEKTVDLAFHLHDLKGKYNFRQIKILQEYDLDLPEVPCEQTEIQQVVLNLLMNAAQAMAEQEERTEAPEIIMRAVRDGNMVRIEVEDNGPGMPENVRKRVFEPFFTTKEVGAGTGLGLSVSYFIITKNHTGTMSVESHPGKGTKFIFYLPLARGV